jgi:predicted oxidoreductase (fatty acid repression mutant protein)
MEFTELLKARKSDYALENKKVVADEILIKALEEAIKQAPTAFNSQATHIVIALGKNHEYVWDVTHDTLKKIVPTDKFAKTEAKLNMFKNGYGTILVYKDEKKIEELKKAFPGFASRQDYWGEQNIGILVYALWLSLYNIGYHANIQHYDPLIDEELAKRFDIPSDWKLETEIVFGKSTSDLSDKPFDPIETRVRIAK